MLAVVPSTQTLSFPRPSTSSAPDGTANTHGRLTAAREPGAAPAQPILREGVSGAPDCPRGLSPAQPLPLPRTQVCGEDDDIGQTHPDKPFSLKSLDAEESPRGTERGPFARGDPSTSQPASW